MSDPSSALVANGLRRNRFFSLKWKALLLTSLMLIAVVVAISYRSYVNLKAQFDRDRQADHSRYQRDIQVLTEQSLEELLKLGGVIPSLPNMQKALQSGDLERIQQAFEPQWGVLQLDWGIDVVSIYDTDNTLLGGWEISEWGRSLTQEVQDWVRHANATDSPVRVVSCPSDCMHFAAVPMLVDQRSAGVVLVGSSLAKLVRDFSEVSSNEIGLLVLGRDECPAENRIAGWDACLVAMTDRERNIGLLRAVASQTLQSALDGVRYNVRGHSNHITLVPLPGYVGDNSAYAVVIADVTETLESIKATTHEVIFVGVTGWILAEMLLLMILWTPMSRLRLTAGNLPLLAQSRFETVRTAIAGRSHGDLLKDEIDILDETAIALANRLEQLEFEVAAHTHTLSRRMDELARERDFVTSLLHTAQVMIVTQDQQGRIVMVNPFVAALTGFAESDLIGQDFVESLISQRKRNLSRGLKKELASNRREHLRHESLVTCKDGSMRNITWYHSRLAGRSEGDPAILSVGLDITERRGAESRLAWMADHDSLTGLMNRRRFQEELELMLDAAKRQGKNGALFIIDLDHFKYINDTSGHHSGDALLKAVAKSLNGGPLGADVVARLGSDEFALLVREVDAEGALTLADAINAAIACTTIAMDRPMVRVSASVGVVLFPKHADNVVDLMACAELAMYQAKEEGGGHSHLFSQVDETRERMRHRVYWREKVSQALDEDKFMLYFQPIMEIRSGRISHYEVLLRMRDEDDSIIGPVHFIDAAERGGMIHAIDRMVISKAIKQLAELRTRGKDISFSINLSGHAFGDGQLLEHIRRELRSSAVDSSKIIFEITETAAVSDFAIASTLMLQVKSLGCRFALDDFGIGFSSFYYLKRLPVDYLKIDGSFIRQLPDNLDDQIIVRAIRDVATGFGKKLIAEYVETEQTLQLLRDLKIDYAQGYLVSKPLSAQEAFPVSHA